MQVTLTSKNHSREHTFNLVVRENEIILTTPNGDEFANLTVCTAETDVKQEDGTYKTVPTDDFFISFDAPVETKTSKESAYVVVGGRDN